MHLRDMISTAHTHLRHAAKADDGGAAHVMDSVTQKTGERVLTADQRQPGFAVPIVGGREAGRKR